MQTRSEWRVDRKHGRRHDVTSPAGLRPGTLVTGMCCNHSAICSELSIIISSSEVCDSASKEGAIQYNYIFYNILCEKIYKIFYIITE